MAKKRRKKRDDKGRELCDCYSCGSEDYCNDVVIWRDGIPVVVVPVCDECCDEYRTMYPDNQGG